MKGGAAEKHQRFVVYRVEEDDGAEDAGRTLIRQF